MPRWKNMAPHLYNRLCTVLKHHSLDILLIAGGGTTCLILSGVFFFLCLSNGCHCLKLLFVYRSGSGVAIILRTLAFYVLELHFLVEGWRN